MLGVDYKTRESLIGFELMVSAHRVKNPQDIRPLRFWRQHKTAQSWSASLKHRRH